MEITEELKAKAYACKTVEELLALAAENDIELSKEEAQLVLDSRAEGEVADEELGGVAGGASGCKRNAYEMVYCKSCAEVEFLFNPGDIVQAFVGRAIGNETSTVEITESTTTNDEHGWYDLYKYDRISGSPTVCGDGWQTRDRFEK